MRMDVATDDKLRREASFWVAAVHASIPSSPSTSREYEENCRQFIKWISGSAEHVAAFLRADETFCRLSGLRSLDRVDVEKLLACHSLNSEELCDDTQVPRTPRWPLKGRKRAILAIAASVLMLVGGAIGIGFGNNSREYSTAVGEQLNVKLPDGTLMLLNTKSHVQLGFNNRQRLVYLTAGEALFEAARNPVRPFIVVTPSARIRAVGTRFNVSAYPEPVVTGRSGTTVSVLEGIVQVAPETLVSAGSEAEHMVLSFHSAIPATIPPDQAQEQQLIAGEQASISNSVVIRSATPNVADAVAWRDRVLVFQGTSIRDIAAEYNRYNTAKIVVDDAEIQSLQMSGTYSADRPQNLVRYLEEVFPVTVVREGENWVIRKR